MSLTLRRCAVVAACLIASTGLAQTCPQGWTFGTGLRPANVTASSGELAQEMGGAIVASFRGEVFRLQGSTWTRLGTDLNAEVSDLLITTDGRLFASLRNIPIVGVTSAVLRWSGSAWVPAATGLPAPASVLFESSNGTIYAGTTNGRVYELAGSAWMSVGAAFVDPTINRPQVQALAELADGSLVAAGRFGSAGGVPLNNVARWDGAAWQPLGSGLPAAFGFAASVERLAVLPSGELIAGGGGFIVPPATEPSDRLARWNGSTWSAVSAIVQSTGLPIQTSGPLLLDESGNLLNASGSIFRFTGTAWQSLVFGFPNTFYTRDALRTPQGEYLLSGGFNIERLTFGDVVPRLAPGFASTIAVCQGALVTSVGVNPTVLSADMTYTWRRNGVAIDSAVNPSAATPVLALYSITTADAGAYDCVVANGCGSITSVVTTINVTTDCPPPDCNDIDFNNDGVFPDERDIVDLFSVFAGGPCSSEVECDDIDFNGDGIFPDDRDLADYFFVLAGGECP